MRNLSILCSAPDDAHAPTYASMRKAHDEEHFNTERPMNRFLVQTKGGMFILAECATNMTLMANDNQNVVELDRLLSTLRSLRPMDASTFGPMGPSEVSPVVRGWGAMRECFLRVCAGSSEAFLQSQHNKLAAIKDKMKEGADQIRAVETNLFVNSSRVPFAKFLELLSGSVGMQCPLHCSELDDFSPPVLQKRQSWLEGLAEYGQKGFQELLKSGALNREHVGLSSLASADEVKAQVATSKHRAQIVDGCSAVVRSALRVAITHPGQIDGPNIEKLVNFCSISNMVTVRELCGGDAMVDCIEQLRVVCARPILSRLSKLLSAHSEHSICQYLAFKKDCLAHC